MPQRFQRTANTCYYLASLLLLTSSSAMAADVHIQLQGLQGTGVIRAALITAEHPQWPAVPLRIAISDGAAKLQFTDVPAGQYAIALYQDSNGNGQLDQSLRGIPQEPVGFSNNPALLNGKPAPAQCGFSHGEDDTQLLIRLYAPPASGSAQRRG